MHIRPLSAREVPRASDFFSCFAVDAPVESQVIDSTSIVQLARMLLNRRRRHRDLGP